MNVTKRADSVSKRKQCQAMDSGSGSAQPRCMQTKQISVAVPTGAGKESTCQKHQLFVTHKIFVFDKVFDLHNQSYWLQIRSTESNRNNQWSVWMQLTRFQRWQMYEKLSPFSEAEGSKRRTAKCTFLQSATQKRPPGRALAIIRKQNGNHWHLSTLLCARTRKGEADIKLNRGTFFLRAPAAASLRTSATGFLFYF